MFNFFSKKELWLPILALIVIGSFIYAFNLNNELFWDDEDWIVNNTAVHSISWDNIKFWLTNDALAGVGLESNYYRPFLFFTFALNWVIAGAEPLVYHLTSNAIHIFNSVLVFWLIRTVFKRDLLAFLVALFFLVHPLQTEAITYISGRGDALTAMFMLLALCLWITDLRSRLSTGFKWLKMCSLAALVLAILSRETAIIFPFLLMVFYIVFLDKMQIYKSNANLQIANKTIRDSRHSHEIRILASFKNAFKEALPYFATVFIYGILRLTVLNFQNTLNFYTEPNVYSESLYVRLSTFLPILWEYVKLLFVPVGLHMERSAVVYTSLFQWPVWPVAVAIVILLYCLIIMHRKEQLNKKQFNNVTIQQSEGTTIQQFNNVIISPFRVWLFGTLWFFIALAPVSGITPINALIYEHWLYLPMIGFWLIVSFYLVKLFDYLNHKSPQYQSEARYGAQQTTNHRQYQNSNDQNSKRFEFVNWNSFVIWKLVLVIFLMFYISFFGLQSVKRNVLWGKQDEFYKDILKYEPKSLKINNNLGNFYYNQGDIEQAEVYYRKAIESGDQFAQPHFNIGSILQSRGDIEGAIERFEKAIEIDPDFYYSYQNLAVIYAQRGELVKAAENMEKLKLLLSRNPRVYYNSALVYIALNDKEQALEDLEEGLKYSKFDPETGRLMKELIMELER